MSDDWRLQGQEKYLKGVVLQRKTYSPRCAEWEHDHCEFCGAKFSLQAGDIEKGYSTADEHHWVCDGCFADFRTRFEWTLSDDCAGPN